MCRPCRWLWGLLPLALLLVAAMALKGSSIESDIAQRAGQRLAADGQGWAGVTLDGRDAVLTGQAPSDDARTMALESAQRVLGLRLIADRSILLPEDKPYRWSAQRDANTLRLKGSVPSDEARARLVGAARQTFPSHTVVDEMKLARGASSAWASGTAFGLSQLTRLVSGTVSLAGADYTIEGRAMDLPAYRQLMAQLPGGLPSGLNLLRQAVLAPAMSPYLWSAELEAGKLLLSGGVPDDSTRAKVLAEVRQALPGHAITDQMMPADGAPEAFMNGVKRGLGVLTRLASGKASLSDVALSIGGTARDVPAYEAAMNDVANLPAGITKGTVAITPARVSPYVTIATKGDNDVLVLEGFAPAPTARDAISAAANSLPGLRVADRLHIAEGVPQGLDWLRSLAFVMGELARLKGGKAEITDGGLAIVGEAGTTEVYAQVRSALGGALPGGLRLIRQEISPPRVASYVWTANRNGNDVQLTGYVPSDESRKQIVALASSLLKGSKINDKMQVAAGAPSGLMAGITHGLAQLGRLDPGEASMQDNALSLKGHAGDEANYDAVTAAMRALPSGVSLGRLAIERQAVRPYTMTLVRGSDGSVSLSGYAPDDAMKSAIAAAAAKAMPQVKVTNALQLAPGLPAGFDWVKAATFASEQLAKIKIGSVHLADSAFSIEGQASDAAALSAIKGVVHGVLAGGMTLAREAVTLGPVSPYTWDLVRDDAGFTLTGYYPDEAAHKALLDRLMTQAYGARIADRMALAPGAPRNWLAGAMLAVDELTRLVRGKANITDSRLTINGEAVSQRVLTELQAYIRTNLPMGFSAEAALKLAEPGPAIAAADCQKLMSDLLANGRILFQTGSAAIDPKSLTLLDFLAFSSRRCPATKLEVSGHTDNVGDPVSNQRLSQRRAEAVIQHLRSVGVAAGRLSAVGFGETKPVASNNDEAGRAKNRRIEFTVKQ